MTPVCSGRTRITQRAAPWATRHLCVCASANLRALPHSQGWKPFLCRHAPGLVIDCPPPLTPLHFLSPTSSLSSPIQDANLKWTPPLMSCSPLLDLLSFFCRSFRPVSYVCLSCMAAPLDVLVCSCTYFTWGVFSDSSGDRCEKHEEPKGWTFTFHLSDL